MSHQPERLRGLRPASEPVGDRARFTFGVPNHCVWCAAPVWRTANTAGQVVGLCTACGLVQPKLRKPVRSSGTPCRECGQPFAPTRRDAVFCSHRCRSRAYRARAIRSLA